MIKEIIEGLKVHNDFAFFNTYIHLFVGVFIASALYPFLSKKKEYIPLVFFPAVFGSIFPDLIFIVSTLFKERSLTGLFYLLSNGGDAYSVFHFGFPLILVIPCTVFIVMIANKVMRRKFDDFPKWGLTWMCLVSFFSALFHVYLDCVGF